MSTRDKLEGKAKELAGKVTGNDDLEDEGRVQHAKGDASERIADAKASATGAVEAAKEAVGDDDPDDTSEDMTDR